MVASASVYQKRPLTGQRVAIVVGSYQPTPKKSGGRGRGERGGAARLAFSANDTAPSATVIIAASSAIRVAFALPRSRHGCVSVPNQQARPGRGLEHVVDTLDFERRALFVRARTNLLGDFFPPLGRDEFCIGWVVWWGPKVGFQPN